MELPLRLWNFINYFAYVHKEVDISQDMSHVESAMSFYIGIGNHCYHSYLLCPHPNNPFHWKSKLQLVMYSPTVGNKSFLYFVYCHLSYLHIMTKTAFLSPYLNLYHDSWPPPPRARFICYSHKRMKWGVNQVLQQKTSCSKIVIVISTRGERDKIRVNSRYTWKGKMHNKTTY